MQVKKVYINILTGVGNFQLLSSISPSAINNVASVPTVIQLLRGNPLRSSHARKTCLLQVRVNPKLFLCTDSK